MAAPCPGEVMTYTIKVINPGPDTMVNIVVTDVLPAGVSLVPGSITVIDGPNAGPKTDAPGDDVAEHDAATHTLTARLGGGAGTMLGGSLAAGEIATVTFDIAIGANTSGIVSNQASISASPEAGGPPQITLTDGNGPDPGAPPTIFVVNPALDSDGDGLTDPQEIAAKTNPYDPDSDDDGVIDGEEPAWNADSDSDGAIDALDPDSDGDGLFDGTEMGKGCGNPATDLQKGHCIPDGDLGATTTSPLEPDTDHGGAKDGDEDTNHNGVVDPMERDPNNAADDQLPCAGDPDCGGPASGVVCNDATHLCEPGCRGTGNGCPPGEMCSSMNDMIGACTPVMGTGGMGGMAGTGGMGGMSGTGGAGGSGGMSGTGGMGGKPGTGGAGGSGGQAGERALVQGGCACKAGDAGASDPAPLLLVIAASIARRTRRSRR
ncbi:MAG: hypothetical protein U0359_06920 [Byssovorax sp.]